MKKNLREEIKKTQIYLTIVNLIETEDIDHLMDMLSEDINTRKNVNPYDLASEIREYFLDFQVDVDMNICTSLSFYIIDFLKQ